MCSPSCSVARTTRSTRGGVRVTEPRMLVACVVGDQIEQNPDIASPSLSD